MTQTHTRNDLFAQMGPKTPRPGLHPKTAAQIDGPVALLHYSALSDRLLEQVVARSMPAQADGYARQLYAALRWADALGVARLLIELPPAEEAWLAVRDRLSRATQSV